MPPCQSLFPRVIASALGPSRYHHLPESRQRQGRRNARPLVGLPAPCKYLPVQTVLPRVAFPVQPPETEEDIDRGRTTPLCNLSVPRQGPRSESTLAPGVQAGAALGRASRCLRLKSQRRRIALGLLEHLSAARKS